MEQVKSWVLAAGAVVIALLILATLVRAVLGPRFTDRIVAVNVISTLVIAELMLRVDARGVSGGHRPGVRPAELSGGGGGRPPCGGAAEAPQERDRGKGGRACP